MRFCWNYSNLFLIIIIRLIHSVVIVYLQYSGFSHWFHSPKSACRVFLSMSLRYPSHSGCLMLRLVCTLTPAEVWSVSWSKGTKTKLRLLNVCAPFGWQAAAHSSTRRWQALTWIQARFPGGNHLECRDASVTGDPVHWGFLTLHSPLSHTHTWGGTPSECVFLICHTEL